MYINGIILVNKDRNISSNAVVNKVKHILNAKKAGHLGTLDVLGEGLLPVTLGKGTKLFDFYLNKDKVYRTVFKFGQTSQTLDLEGEIIYDEKDVDITIGELERVLTTFIGKQNQMPPIFSAKKINGRKAYDLARDGEIPALKPKLIEIYNIRCLRKIEKNTFELEIHCSAGTYIRSVCRDIANRLSTYGIMLSIQRTKCGEFDINSSYTIEQIKNGDYKIFNLYELFSNSDLFLDDAQFKKVDNGVILGVDICDGDYKCWKNNLFLGIANVKNGKLKLKLRLY